MKQQKRVLIIGLGIGSMYKKLLEPFYEVVTVDTDESENPTYSSLEELISMGDTYFNLGIVCTPNYLHYEQVHKILFFCNNVLVEKPGFKTSKELSYLYSIRKNVFLTKNNIYRVELPLIKEKIKDNFPDIKEVEINWINYSRVPHPGSWFTTKEKAFGGTSVDSFPHLLSELLFILNNTSNVLNFSHSKEQRFKLEEVLDTDYGVPNPNGTYDVDDYCNLKLDSLKFSLTGNWKSNEKKEIGITILYSNGKKEYFDFDLCPEYCYQLQFEEFLNLSEERREYHHTMDLLIHQVIENL